MTGFHAIPRSRRAVLRGAAAATALVASWRMPGSAKGEGRAATGELWGGFLLLPAGEELPPGLRQDRRHAPPAEGSGAFDVQFPASVAEAAKTSGVVLYDLSSSSTQGMESLGSVVTREMTGRPFMVTHAYGYPSGKLDPRLANAPTFVISAEPRIATPIPIRPPRSPRDVDQIPIRRHSAFATPAILVQGPGSGVAQWVDRDVLYTLEYRRSLTAQEVDNIAHSLFLVEP